jgi:hypothetical protein
MMLLPLPTKEVTNISLGYHLALQACRNTGGTIDQLRDLTRALYLTYYLEKQGYGNAGNAFYRSVEAHLEVAARRAMADNIGCLESEGATAMMAVLRLLDGQLATAQTRHVFEANRRLTRFVMGSDKTSPFDA